MKNNNYKQTEIGEIPMDWKENKIGSLIDILSGYAFKSSDFRDIGVPVIKIKNITPTGISLTDIDYVSGELFEKKVDYQLKYGDVLISLTGSNVNQMDSAVGKVCEVNLKNQRLLLNQRVGKIFPIDKNKCDIRYIYYYLNIENIRYSLASSAGGAANQANISPDQIKSLLIPTPEYKEQERIANFLSSLDDKIELNRKMNKTLGEIGKALFKRWFVDFEFPNDGGKPYKSSGGKMVDSELGEIPEGWEAKPLDTIATFLNGVACQKYPPKDEVGLPVIKIGELHNGITENSDRASSSIASEYIVEDDDVLFSWSGSLEIVLWTGGRGVLNQHLFKVSSESYPKWFYYQWALRYLPFFREIASNKVTTMGHIQRSHLTESFVLVPQKTTLEKMDLAMTPLLDKVIANSIEIKSLAQIRDSLLPRLMSGKLRV